METTDGRIHPVATIDEEIVAAAMEWWRGKRPVNWSEQEHAARFAVNCVGERQAALAERCARAAKEERRAVESQEDAEGRSLGEYIELLAAVARKAPTVDRVTVNAWERAALRLAARLAEMEDR